MLPVSSLEALLKRDRLVILGGLALLALLSWGYMGHLVVAMDHMDMAAMAAMESWSPKALGLLFAMWAVMMVAMMLPSAAPMILLFASVNRRRFEQSRPYVPTAVFAGGYLAAWTAFSAAATLLQAGLHSAALLSCMMSSTSRGLGAAILIGAGLFQWTPLKNACLSRCQSPLGFLLADWREGTWGAFRMGWRHGFFCVGCCWLLMAILFVAGVMNLLWIGVITLFVLVEKLSPGPWLSRATGAALIGWGLWFTFVPR